ncbi:MAG: EamA family transporter [Chloroflexota bacterium]
MSDCKVPASYRAHLALRPQYVAAASVVRRTQSAARAVPPPGLLVVSILSVQLGSATAKGLFHALGPTGAVFLRIFIGALLLFVIQRPRWRGHSRDDYLSAAALGVAIAIMNLAFYAAISRLPLGMAVTVEFVGPLAVAVAGSLRRLDLLWGALAAFGVILLAPIGGASFDSIGILLALVAAAGWAGYILLNVRVGRAFSGGTGLSVAMLISALAVLPLGVGTIAPILAHPRLLAIGAAVAILSAVIPFSLEHAALKTLPARVFGVLMSGEPAIAALVGAIFLGETLGIRGLIALACVSAATAGSAGFRGKSGP